MSTSRRPRRSTVLLLVAVLLLAAGTWVAYFSPLLVVRDVTVAGGGRAVGGDEVTAAAAVPMGTPLARQDVQGIAERVTGIPAVRAASVTRRWPGTIVITVTERQGVLAVRQADGFVLVDGDGVAYDQVPTLPKGAILADVSAGDQRLLREVGRVAAALPAELLGEVTRLEAAGPDGITLKLRSGVDVVWGDAGDSPLKAQIVAALLKQKPKKTIDVSSPNSPATS